MNQGSFDVNRADDIKVDMGRNISTRDGSPGSILNSRDIVEKTVLNQKRALLSSGDEIGNLLKQIDELNRSVAVFDKSTKKTFGSNSYVRQMNKEAKELTDKLASINRLYEDGNITLEELNKLHEGVVDSILDARDAVHDVNSVYDRGTGKIKEQTRAIMEQSIIRRNMTKEQKKANKDLSDQVKRDIKEQQKSLAKANKEAFGKFAGSLRDLAQTLSLSKMSQISDVGSASKLQYQLQQTLGLDKQQFGSFRRQAIGGVDTGAYSSRQILDGFDAMKSMDVSMSKAADLLPTIIRGQQLLGMNADTQAKLVALGNKTGRDQLAFTTNKMSQFLKHGNDLSLKTLNQIVDMNTNLSNDMLDAGIDSEAFNESSANAMGAIENVFKGLGKSGVYDATVRSLVGNVEALGLNLGMDTTTFRQRLLGGDTPIGMISEGHGAAGQMYKQMQTKAGYENIMNNPLLTSHLDPNAYQLVKLMADAYHAGTPLDLEMLKFDRAASDAEALREQEKMYKKALGPFGTAVNSVSNFILKEFDWQDQDLWRRGLLTSVLSIQALLTASELLKAGKGWLSKGGALSSVGGAIVSNGASLAGASLLTKAKIGGAGLLAGYGVGKLGDIGDSYLTSKGKSGLGSASNILGDVGGGVLAGAAMGSFLPGPGNVIGAVIGGIGGLVKGIYDVSKKSSEKQLSVQERIANATEQSQSSLESLRNVRFSANAIPRSALNDYIGGQSGTGVGGGSSWPVTSNYGKRVVQGVASTHKGIDFGIPYNTKIGAAAAGTVIKTVSGYPATGWYKDSKGNVNPAGLANQVQILTDDGHVMLYGHLTSPAVKQGARVRAGELIGYSGSSGTSTGAHLHFQVNKNGQHIPPHSFVNSSLWSGVEGISSDNSYDSSKADLLDSLTGTYTVKLGSGQGSSDAVVSGLSQINQTLIDLSSKQSQQEQVLSMLAGKSRPAPYA